MEEALVMGMRERDRLHAIRNVLEGRLTQREAGRLLGRSERQVRRLCARVRVKGDRGVIHGLRGLRSNNHLTDSLLERVLSAVHDPRWDGFGPTFASEKLRELYGLRLGTTTLRRLMIGAGIWEPSARRGRRHRAWRERRPCMGMMVQLDGSDHDWFEGRSPRCVLLIYIDDATSRILYGEFVKVEDTLTLLRTTGAYLKRHGRPGAFYVDKDSIYKVNKAAGAEENLPGEEPTTQFTRAMGELGIEVTWAHSPQAKGRVERGFKTHQDRLVKELRLAGVSTMGQANAFLWQRYIPEHNRRFAVPAAQAGDAHRPLLPIHSLDRLLSLRIERVVQNDFTVRYGGKFLQLLADSALRVKPKDKVLIETRLDGSLHVQAKGRYLPFKRLDSRPDRPRRESFPTLMEIERLRQPPLIKPRNLARERWLFFGRTRKSFPSALLAASA